MSAKKIALDLDINIKKGDITLGELNSQFQQIGDTVQEQKDILIEFKKELLEVEKIRASTSATNFGRISNLKDRETQLKNAISDQRVSLEGLNNERGKASAAIKNITADSVNQSKVIQGVDKLTGGMATKVIKLYKGFKEGSRAIKIFNAGLSTMAKALIATGLGALVVALGLVVAYWEDIVGYINGASAEQNKLLADTEKTKKANEESLAATEASENSLKLQGMSEKEILELKRKQTDEVIMATEAQLEQQKAIKVSQIAAAERNQKIAAGIIGFITAPISLLLTAVDALTYGLAKIGVMSEGTELLKDFTMGTASLIGFDPNDVKGKGEETIKETETQLKALKNKRDGFILKGQEDDKKQRDKSKADSDKLAKEKEKEKEAADKDEEKAAQEKANALEEIRSGQIDTEEELRQEELDKVDKHYEELISKARQYGLDTTELELARDAKKQEIFDKQDERDAAEQAKKDEKLLKEQETLIDKLGIDQDRDELTFIEQREDMARREAIFLQDKTLTEEQRNEVESKFSKERKAIEKGESDARIEINAQRVDMALNTLNALNGLVQAFAKDDEESQKKAFNANKAFGIAQAIISTAQGIATQLAVPQDALTGANFIKAGIVAATGAAQIATISKTQFKGAATAPTPPPSENVVGDVGLIPRGFTSTTNRIEQQTTKVIVTETDIRNVTRNVEGIYSRAVVVQ